jgi:hypothetical protein
VHEAHKALRAFKEIKAIQVMLRIQAHKEQRDAQASQYGQVLKECKASKE